MDNSPPSGVEIERKFLVDRLPGEIEALERRIGELEREISAADFYGRGHEEVQAVLGEHSERQAALDAAIERWTELEDRQQALSRG